MSSYALVQDGVIVRPPQPLPTDFAGILNFHKHPAPEEHGWYPVSYGPAPSYDRFTEKLVANMSISGNTVVVSYEKRGMTAAEIREAYPVPAKVTAAQGMTALNNMKLLDDVEQLVSAADRNTQIWYNRAVYWERGNPILAALAAGVGLTETQVDDLFRTASRL